MKKKFQKISKIVFYAAMLALLGLLLCVSAHSGDTIDGIWGAVSLFCILIIIIFCAFSLLNFVVACVEGWKKDKKEIIKKIAVQYVVMIGVYVFLCITDAEQQFDFIKLLGYATITTVGIIGGGYMMEKHEENDNN